jgi:hypothetical protein
MITKVLGFVVGGLGVIGVACWSYPGMRTAIPKMPEIVSALGGDTMLIIVSAIFVLFGLFILVKGGGGKQEKEVPIFQGKHIVGYRRV